MKKLSISLLTLVALVGLLGAARIEGSAAAPAAAPRAAERTMAAAPALTAAPGPNVTFPEKGKTITLIVPFAAGGGADVAGRLLAADLAKLLGTQVVVANRPGAGGQTGVQEMLQAKPDGYTLIEATITTTITQMVNPARQATFKSKQDFTLVAGHNKNQQILAVRADSPWKTLKDLVDYAKANPGKVRVSDNGLLATPNLTMLVFQKLAGVRFSYVHFGGSAEAIPALLGGHVEAVATGVPDIRPFFESREVRVLGIADNVGSQFLTGVPTMESQGWSVPSFSGAGVMGPKDIPKAVVDILTGAIKRVLATDEQKKKLSGIGYMVRYLSPEEYSKVWDDTQALVEPLVKQILAEQQQQKK